jgi:hypothetical protein
MRGAWMDHPNLQDLKASPDGNLYFQVIIKVKLSVRGCGGLSGCKTLRFPHFLENQLTDGGETVSLTHWPPFTPRKFLVLISVRGRVDPRATVRLKGLGQWKNPMTSLGIKPVTFQLVAKCLNQLYNCVLSFYVHLNFLWCMDVRRYFENRI